MIVLYFILSIIFGIFLSLCYVHLMKYRDIRNVPGPSAFLAIFSMFSPKLTSQEAFELVMSLNKVYGPVAKIWINPFSPKLIITDLKYIENLLSSTAHVEKTKFYRFLGSFIDEGLATAPGFPTVLFISAASLGTNYCMWSVPEEAEPKPAMWKHQRKIFNPAIHNRTLKQYVETFETYGDELITEMTHYAGGPSFDVLPTVTTCTMHIICATLMQLNSCCAEEDLSGYSQAREGFFRILVARSLSILTQYNFLFRYTETYLERERHAKILNDFSKKVIDAYRKQANHAKFEEDKHVVENILENYDFGSKEMLDHVGTFIVAGHETVAVTLGFALYELAKHPEIQRKIVQESSSVLGKNKNVHAKFSDLQNLKYVECVIKESLRKYTTIPAFERKTTEPMEIDGVRVPESMEVMICAYNVHLDEENYPNPDVFDPDRFLPENESKIKPFAYLPFSLGPRNCIGKQFAILQLKSLLTKFLRHYEVLPAETTAKMEFFSEFSLKSAIGTPIRIIPRSQIM